MSEDRLIFNPPPGWPKPPDGWIPTKGWSPDPAWPAPPAGWQLWIPSNVDSGKTRTHDSSESPQESPSAPVETPETKTVLHEDSDQRIATLEAENAALRAQLNAATTSSEEIGT